MGKKERIDALREENDALRMVGKELLKLWWESTYKCSSPDCSACSDKRKRKGQFEAALSGGKKEGE